MKFYKHITTLASGAVLAISSLMVLGFAPIASAASCTWTGGGSDNKFSTTANWSGCSGSGGVPGNGDVITINNTSGALQGLEDDISSLSLGGINFTGNFASTIEMRGSQILTLTGDISSTVSGNDRSAIKGGTVVLGADITADSVDLDDYLSVGELQLNNHKLTVEYSNTNSSSLVVIIAMNITGTGTIVVDTHDVSLSLSGNNTYTGTTKIISGTIADFGSSTPDYSKMLGTSDVVVGANATLLLHFDSASTFDNTITLEQASKSAEVWGNQLSIFNDANSGSNFTVSIPNIILQGNTRFGIVGNGAGNNTKMYVDLAGVEANSHCVQYGGDTNSQSKYFRNGPKACVVAATTGNSDPVNAPKAGDTGFSLVSSNPISTLGTMMLLAGVVIVLAQKIRKLTNK